MKLSINIILLPFFTLSCMYFATTTTAACSSTSQPAPNAVLVSIEKCEDSPNKGIFVELGELGNSGLQPSCLLPSTVLDSITVMSKEICSSKSLNPGENERSCKAKRGHTYDPESSKSWSEVQGGFPERPENFFKSLNHTWRSGMETVRIDTATEDQKVIEQAEVIAVTAGKNSTMGSFPIGPYSYVMKRMEWEEFGLYGGSQFRLQDSVPGALTLGGYDGSRVKGTPYKFPVNNETAEGRICPFRVPINNLVVRFIEEGKDATEVPLMDEVAETIACVEPLDVLFRFPRTIMRDWLEATEHDNRIRNETVPQGWQYPEPGLVYSNNSKIQTAELVIRLEQGLEITIPNEELVRKLVGMDGNGEYKVIDDGPEGLWESAIFDNVKDSGIVPNNTMTLGMIFLSQAYLHGYYPKGEPPMFFLSKVTEGSTASSLVSTSDSCNDNDNKAAVIGGSVGGGVALVLLILATVLCCRPERQNRPAAPAEDNPGPQVAVAPIANPRENLAPYNQDPPPRVNELPHNNRINP